MPRLMCAIAVYLLFAPGAAEGQAVASRRVLVMPFGTEVGVDAPGGASGSLWLGEAAALLLTDNLRALGYDTFSREERVSVFERLQVPMSASLTRATTIRVAELIGASEVVFGDLKLDHRLEVRARRIALDAGRELPAALENASLSEIFVLFDRLAAKLTAGLTPPQSLVMAKDAPIPLEAFESYVKGLVATTPAAQQRFLEGAMRLAPSDPRVLLALADVYAAQGAHDRALSTANAVASTSPMHRRARFSVALSLIELKRFDGAYQELTGLYAARRSAALSNALGIVQLRRGILTAAPPATSATTYFARAVNEAQEQPDYLFNLGYAHALAQNAVGALTWLRETVRFDAADGDAHLVMTAVLFATGRTAEAQRELELARLLGTSVESVGPPAARAPAGLERIDLDLDSTAVPQLNAAISGPARSDQRETAAFHVTRAKELFDQRKDREAADELRRAVYLEPYHDEAHLLLGRLYQRTGQISLAIDEFKVAAWCRETADAQVALGSALLDSGDRDGARVAADRALVLAPSSASARELLRRIGP